VRRFVRSELLVMQGLLDDGTHSDKDIAERFGMKTGTVASARRRLVSSGTVTYAYIPAFNRLGCEMLGFHLGTADLTVSLEKRSSQYAEFCTVSPQVFFGILGGNSVLFYTALKDATEHERFMEGYDRFFSGKMKGSRTRLQSHMFPYRLSWGTYSLNFSPLVRLCYGVEGPEPRARLPRTEDIEEPDLKGTEAKGLVTFVEKPWLTDEAVSNIIGVSRQAVTSMRNKFVERGLLHPAWIPDLRTWGLEILVAIHAHFLEEIPWEKVTGESDHGDLLRNSFFTMAKKYEVVGNHISPSFEHFSDLSDRTNRIFERLPLLGARPEIALFPLGRARFLRYFEFGPAVRHLLLGDGRR